VRDLNVALRSVLADPPAECPRARDGGAGPRRCELVECDWHLYKPEHSSRAVGCKPERIRLVVLSKDTCTKDVADRVKTDGALLSYSKIARMFGASRQAMYQATKRAIGKIRRAADDGDE
jgi:hypothetical protein